MKLQTRVGLSVGLVFAVLIVLIAVLAGTAFRRGLVATETREAAEAAQRLRRIIAAENEVLWRTARDYAEWDDSVAYVRAPNPAYEASNWTAASFANVQVDAMLLFDRAGRFIGGAALTADRTEIAPPGEVEVAAWADTARRVAVSSGGAVARLDGLARWRGDPAFAACLPVCSPSAPNAPVGALVVLRRIDEKLRDRIEALLGAKTELAGVGDWPAMTGVLPIETDVQARYLSETQMAVALRLRDQAGAPLVVVRAELERTAYQEGVRARWHMLALLVAVAVVVGCATHWLLRQLVIRRLELLSGELAQLAATPGARARVHPIGRDEITAVAVRINEMFDRLEGADREREQARKERELLQEQLVHAQKMEAVGEFAGGIAHDFNNCLTSITCWLQLSKEELPHDHPVQENLSLALNSVSHAASVVRQLLTYGRQGAGPLAELRLGELLSESLLLLRSGLPRTVELRLHTSGTDDRVMADRTQLLQVVMNLLNNARDAMDGRGTLTINLDEVELPSLGTAPANHLPGGHYVRISVQDTGPGIPAELRDRIFQPFFTTKPTGKGTGLGLAVVQSVVTRHSGAVWVESEPGHGAVFHVVLPRATASAAPETDPTAEKVRGLRVLVVEDDPAVARVLTMALARRGCELTLAPDGEAGWEKWTGAEVAFDVVLTDFTLPRMNGLQLAGKILESDRRVPVILMTAYGATLDPEQVRQAGLATVLAKPLEYDAVVRALAEAVGSRARPDAR